LTVVRLEIAANSKSRIIIIFSYEIDEYQIDVSHFDTPNATIND